jgi:starch synthase
LADTIKPVVPASRTGTGFLFSPYEADAFLGSVRQALQAYRDRGLWQALQQNGMAEDFSWEASAKQYIQLYRKAIKKGAA